jgi:hypothetical protein
MTRRYRATTFSIAVAGALAIAACSTDDGATEKKSFIGTRSSLPSAGSSVYTGQWFE